MLLGEEEEYEEVPFEDIEENKSYYIRGIDKDGNPFQGNAVLSIKFPFPYDSLLYIDGDIQKNIWVKTSNKTKYYFPQ